MFGLKCGISAVAVLSGIAFARQGSTDPALHLPVPRRSVPGAKAFVNLPAYLTLDRFHFEPGGRTANQGLPRVAFPGVPSFTKSPAAVSNTKTTVRRSLWRGKGTPPR